eukprot:Seg6.5 transcript_id=Seg6.5/GoldUCD/mRNA.D3Y31 product=Ovochymase-1 protein_id=Seg6.5/GoldUCD/D3Y31
MRGQWTKTPPLKERHGFSLISEKKLATEELFYGLLIAHGPFAVGENLNGNYGCLASPGYPGNYSKDQIKSYYISVSKGLRVELTFHKFELEAEDSCNFDYVEIVDPSTGTSRKYCGSNKPPMQISRENSIIVNFKSDGGVQDKGFFASFVETNQNWPVVCRHSFTAASGSFSSPGYPSNYPSNANCEYSITVQTGKAVKIVFSPFSVENGQGCTYDFVKIYEDGSLKESFCGVGSKNFTAKKNSVKVVFRSDGSVSKSGFRAIYTTVDQADIVPTGINHPFCGMSRPPPPTYVIGGKDAAKGAWPWQIGIYINGTFMCGGSLIALQWVLTAAHCISFLGIVEKPNTIKVVVGDLHRELNDSTERTHDVQLHLVHPSYNESYANNDIALMRLTKPVILNNYVNTVCMPNKAEPIKVGSTCFITGWGSFQRQRLGDFHVMLQQVKLPVLDSRICQAKLDKAKAKLRITDQMVCAGKEGSIKSGCHGDSGGPFVCPNKDGRFVLHGVVSWGSPRCDTTQAYSVFARTTEFVDWVVASLQAD